MAESGALARRRARLADLPAPVVLQFALALAPRDGCVRLRPAGDGRVIVEAGSARLAAVAEVRGELDDALALPCLALAKLAKRHPTAERLSVDGPHPDGPPGLLLRAIDASGAATLLCNEGAMQAGDAGASLAASTAVAEAGARLVAPLALRTAADALQRLCSGPITLELPEVGSPIGAILRGRPDPASDVLSAVVALARVEEEQGDPGGQTRRGQRRLAAGGRA